MPSAEGRRQHGAVHGHRIEQDILDTVPAELLEGRKDSTGRAFGQAVSGPPHEEGYR